MATIKKLSEEIKVSSEAILRTYRRMKKNGMPVKSRFVVHGGSRIMVLSPQTTRRIKNHYARLKMKRAAIEKKKPKKSSYAKAAERLYLSRELPYLSVNCIRIVMKVTTRHAEEILHEINRAKSSC